jgi:hypothetical protein
MPKARRIRAELRSAGRGGHAVVLGDDVVAALGLKQHTRVKGTIGGIPYRSSTARYGGAVYLGVHKATVERAGIAVGDVVAVTIEVDAEPREIEVPAELERALGENPEARSAWEALAPSHKREHARAVAEAKKEATRRRRVERTIDALLHRGGA